MDNALFSQLKESHVTINMRIYNEILLEPRVHDYRSNKKSFMSNIVLIYHFNLDNSITYHGKQSNLD